MAEMIHMTINGNAVEVEKGSTILQAARKLKIHIPTLCHLDMHKHKMVNKTSSCRVCVVEEVGRSKMLAACSTLCKEGMNIRTDSLKVIRARRMMIELLLSNHPTDCLVCSKNGICELQALASEAGIRTIHYPGERHEVPIDRSSYSLVRDMSKCILCKRCETMCNDVQTVGALTDVGRGFETVVGTFFNGPMYESTCTFCGQCVTVCPTGALTDVDNTEKVWRALSSNKTVIVQTAPAVRVALGEIFGMPVGSDVTGKMVTGLRRMGFDYVFDTNFAADVTVMEEAAELVERIKNGTTPILTSCCPSWVKFIEEQFPDCLHIPSSAKSPHEMFGSLAKTYLAERIGVKPEDMVVVSVMPCIAKKYESERPELGQNKDLSDVDIVITTRELGQMLKELALEFDQLEDSEYDHIMGESSGAGDIFGTTGGVIEAALRTAYFMLTGEELEEIEFESLRGLEGIKEATVDVRGKEVKIACANGLGNARTLLERIRSGEADYTAIEIMACPGGCITGGGQPYHDWEVDVATPRMQALYAHDRAKSIRRSHQNPMVKKLYAEFLGQPLSEKSLKLLHTRYFDRSAKKFSHGRNRA